MVKIKEDVLVVLTIKDLAIWTLKARIAIVSVKLKGCLKSAITDLKAIHLEVIAVLDLKQRLDLEVYIAIKDQEEISED